MGKHTTWRRPLGYAAAVSIVIFGLFYYWFGVANRYILFLYGHTANNISTTQPFDSHTASRHWMAGLVAAGIVLVLYTAASWLAGRIAARRGHSYEPPDWWRIWLLCVPLVGLGIPLMVMMVNTPTLPPSLAAACVVATLVGLAVALMPGRMAAERPDDLLWLAADGLGLVPPLLLLRVVELPGRGLSVSPAIVWTFAIGGTAVGFAWLVVMSLLRRWRRKATPGVGALVAAGLGLSFLMTPLLHYLVAGPPGYRYISNADNFLAHNLYLTLLSLVVTVGLAVVVTEARKRACSRQARAATAGDVAR